MAGACPSNFDLTLPTAAFDLTQTQLSPTSLNHNPTIACLLGLQPTASMSAALTTDVDKRLLRTTKFPPEFNVKVDMKKVNVPLIKKWVADEIARILNSDDDVVTELIFNMLEGSRNVSLNPLTRRKTVLICVQPNIKELQISLGGFLEKQAATFSSELWKLCLSAQENPQGIPKELLEAKKAELIQERVSCLVCSPLFSNVH